MDFSVIIINYRQKEFVVNCVNSLRKNLNCNYEIIIVNNSPEDDFSVEGIKIILNSNKGYSQANNIAAKEASGKYILFLNADTVLEKDFANDFLREFEGREFGAAGLGLKYPDGKYQLSYWNENTFRNEAVNKKLEKAFKENYSEITSKYGKIKEIKEVHWVSGAAMIIRKEVFENAGGFDEEYFLFYEDADLCKRIKAKGYKIFYYPFDGLIHFKGENVNQSFTTDTYYYSKKSQLIYYRKHNNLFDKIRLRVYLASKFFYKMLTKRNGINMKIFKLVTGMEK